MKVLTDIIGGLSSKFVVFNPLHLMILLFFLTVNQDVFAQPPAKQTWQGGASGDWTLAANWDNGGILANGDTAVIPNGSTATITSNIDGFAPSVLIIESGAGLIINQPSGTLTTSDTISVAGTFTLTAGDLVATGLVVRGTVNFGGGSHIIEGKDLQIESGTVNSDSAIIQLDYSFNTSTTANFTKNGGTFNEDFSTYRFSSGQSQSISSNSTLSFYKLEHVPGSSTPSLDLNSLFISITNEFNRGGRSNGITNAGNLSYDNGTTLRYSFSTARSVSGEWVSPDGVDNVINASSVNVTLGSPRTIPSDGTLTLNQTGGNFIVNNVALNINGSLERKTAATTGITTSGSGSVQYNTTGSMLKYNTSANTTIGAEWPAAGASPPENVEITITGGGTLTGSASKTIPQDLTLNVGTVNLGTNTLTVSGTVAGSEIEGSAVISNNTTLFIGNGTSDNTYAQWITGNLTLNKLTVDKRDALSDDPADSTVTVNGSLTFSANGTLTVTQGILAFGGPGKLTGTLASLNLTIGAGGVLKTGGTTLTTIGGTINTANGKVVFNGSGTAETMPAWSLSELEVANAAGVSTSGGTLNVADSLILTGGTITTMTSNVLRLGTAAAVSGTPGVTKMVKGPLQKSFNAPGSFTYPVGSGTTYGPATFQYDAPATFSGTSIIAIEHSTAGFIPKTLPQSPEVISAVDQSSHYIVRERGTPQSGLAYTFTGTFIDGNFNPEDRNRILVETASSYTNLGSSTVDTDLNTATAGSFNALPSASNYFIVFGAGGTTVTWDGEGADGNWFNASNWDPDGIPTPNDDVLITGAVSISVDNDSAAKVSTLTLGDGINKASLTITTVDDSLWIYDAASSALTVKAVSEIILGNADGIIFDPTVAAIYDSSKTALLSGSRMEYQTGSVKSDLFGNLIVNGATGTSGEAFTVRDSLIKDDSGSEFAPGVAITVLGPYINIAGNADYSTGSLTVNGSPFTLSAGTLDGTININSTVTNADGGDFTGASCLVTYAGSASQTINGTFSADFYNLTISNAQGINLGTDISVNNNLTLSAGIITTGTNTVILEQTGSVVGGGNTNYVDGNFSNTYTTTAATEIFPLGSGNVYRPVQVNAETASGSADLTGTLVEEDATNVASAGSPLVKVSELRYYSFANTVSTLQVNQITNFKINSDDGVGDINPNNTLRLASNIDASGDWTQVTLASAPDTRESQLPIDITSSASLGISVNSGSILYLTLGTTDIDDNSLPVELSSFTAAIAYNQVTLSWKTFSELENDGFYLYRREASTGDWGQLNPVIIAGQGNTSNETYYQFIDKTAVAGQTYEYMLESVSFSGVRVQEKVIRVAVPVPAVYALLGNYPNPFNPTTNIRFQLPEQSAVSLKIYDLRGNLVNEVALNRMFPAGEHNITWDATDNGGRKVASGLYIYMFQAGTFQKTGRMILLK